MSSYHQMGHDSWNLVGESALAGFGGLILSPVNDSPGEVLAKLGKLKKSPELEIILDPQLYKPSSDRGKLVSWDHFTPEVDTVDLGNGKWWDDRGQSLCAVAQQVGAHAICSPAMLPKVFEDDYYRWTTDVASRLVSTAEGKGIQVLLTAIIPLNELVKKGKAEAIATILTSVDISRIYLVFHDDLYPRDQRSDFQALAGGMRLIRLLEQAGSEVLTAFSGLDMLLWKAAGAKHVATGKFFNLRRFVPGRWEEQPEGGRVVPYWTEGGLIAWLREDDLRLLDSKGLIDRAAAASNPFAAEILKIIDSGQAEAWVGLAWRQYLHWFNQIEAQLSSDPSLAATMLKHADGLWTQISDQGLYMFDRKNTGEWVRPWLNAISLLNS